MSQKWQDATILVPAGVEMTRMADGVTRTWDTGLQFKAYRYVDGEDNPIDDVWHFQWLSKLHQVPHKNVQVIKA